MIVAPVEIEVFLHTKYTQDLSKNELEYKLEDCIIRKVTLYKVSSIYPFFENDIEVGTYIWSDGNDFISPIPYNELKGIINRRI